MIFYRLQNYQDKKPVEGQKFEKEKDLYRLNKTTGILEKTGEKIDIDAVIQSCVSTTLDALLERFLPQDVIIDSLIRQREELHDDLDFFQESFMKADEYRKMFNLPDHMSVNDVFEFVKKKHDDLGKKVNELQEKENNKGGEQNEEKETKPEAKPEVVPPSGETGTQAQS